LYLVVLALVEALFAVGTVLLGESLIRRERGWLMVLGGLGIGLSLLAVHRLHRRLRDTDVDPR
jgi:hypothetical protein